MEIRDTTTFELSIHLITWIEDTLQVINDKICAHNEFAGCLQTMLNWSKNVQEDSDAPWQKIIHLITWIDDTLQVINDKICAHNEFSGCLQTMLNWSKNVHHGRRSWGV